jgi:hypothetical protein
LDICGLHDYLQIIVVSLLRALCRTGSKPVGSQPGIEVPFRPTPAACMIFRTKQP